MNGLVLRIGCLENLENLKLNIQENIAMTLVGSTTLYFLGLDIGLMKNIAEGK